MGLVAATRRDGDGEWVEISLHGGTVGQYICTVHACYGWRLGSRYMFGVVGGGDVTVG